MQAREKDGSVAGARRCFEIMNGPSQRFAFVNGYPQAPFRKRTENGTAGLPELSTVGISSSRRTPPASIGLQQAPYELADPKDQEKRDHHDQKQQQVSRESKLASADHDAAATAGLNLIELVVGHWRVWLRGTVIRKAPLFQSEAFGLAWEPNVGSRQG